ncbi:MAG: cbb3-type cytochrome c oxidase subunit I [Planctomycetota bacterium]
MLGNLLLPLMIGARDLAFPRLNLASWCVYVAGAVLTILALLWTRADTGWTFYTPYSTSTGAILPVVFGIVVLGVCSATRACRGATTPITSRIRFCTCSPPAAA